ncbi:aspartate-semialdehyde dehydrogenase [Pseudomonas sp. NCCP-436]|uniref:aspartate-semialdehyde dehydrogenase n=1 Tax=Pseudomonas sp. NCCP-436 TaxID=2842481 RepID=UPI001C7EB047|nr:aspartate-semialdehyde dehydrogenase [Pseudomonas sp. NCCP-436]GIZ13570.1 aspartate-semialdehyde dehydrogenase [Pseudomonas sp. NCCP-436]
MSRTFNVALIGSADTITETLVELLDERNFPIDQLYLLALGEALGQSLAFRGRQLRFRALDNFDFAQVQLAFVADELPQSCRTRALAAGCSLIDMTAGLPLDQAPCVVPELTTVAPGESAPFLLSTPTPSAVACALVMAALSPQLKVRRVQLTAMLSVSTLGREGVQELARQTAELLNARPLEPRLVDRQLAFNVLARTGEADEQGHTLLEQRLTSELRQLLQLPELPISVTCALAPVFFGDSLSLSLQCDEEVGVAVVQRLLEAAPGLELVEVGDYPTAVGDAVGQDQVYVGRVRAGVCDLRQLNLWIVSDNVRKGTALNALQIAELLIKHYL